MVGKAGKHKRSKLRGHDLCWKPHERSHLDVKQTEGEIRNLLCLTQVQQPGQCPVQSLENKAILLAGFRLGAVSLLLENR